MTIDLEKPNYPEHLNRMFDEKEELTERLGKLNAFIYTNSMFKDLPLRQQELMKGQRDHMQGYLAFLTTRVDIAVIEFNETQNKKAI